MQKSLQVTFIFRDDTNPGNPQHLHEILKNELSAKGVKLEEDNTVDLRI